MRFSTTRWFQPTRLARYSWAAWLMAWIVVALLMVTHARRSAGVGNVAAGQHRSVTRAYRDGALAWVAGKNMYNGTGRGFIYLPQAAILYVPFAMLPVPLGGLLWRAISLSVFALGVYRAAHLIPGDVPRAYFHVATLSLILCLDVLRNGQSTLLMCGLMLLAVDAMSRGGWNRSACFLALGVAVKPLAIVLVLVAIVLERRLRGRLALALAMMIVFPFAVQKPGYVVWQFQECQQTLAMAAAVGDGAWWAQLFGMLRTFGVDCPAGIQMIARVVAALVTLAASYFAYRRFETRRALVWLYALTAVYLMLFNPRTENSTYCVLGPALGLFYAEELVVRRHRRAATLLLFLAVAATGTYEIGKLLTPVALPAYIWLAPLACSLFAVYLAGRYWQEARETARETPRQVPSMKGTQDFNSHADPSLSLRC